MWYLDTSALLKLIVDESETEPMRAFAAAHDELWSSRLVVTESLRAGARLGLDAGHVLELLDRVSLVLPAAGTFHVAGLLAPIELRSLDALHLASAQELGADLEAILTYDERLAGAARRIGMAVLSPS